MDLKAKHGPDGTYYPEWAPKVRFNLSGYDYNLLVIHAAFVT